MSLKNIGSAINATGGITQFLNLLSGLGGFSFSNMSGLTNVISVFKEMKQMTEGMTALRTISALMKSFDGTDAALVSIGKALSGLKMETATAILGMTGLNEQQLTTVLMAANVDASLAAETASIIASGSAASGASVGFGALASSMLGAAKAVLVFLATNPVGWFITAGVALLAWTKHVENHNKALREASQAADEYASSSKDTYEKEVEETESLNNLIDKYKELKRQYEAGGELDSNLRSQILDVQTQITDMVGSQADSLDLVNGKLDEELGKLGDIAKEQAKQEKEAANTAYKAAVDAAEKATNLGLKGGGGLKKQEIYDYVGKMTKAEKDAFYDAGYNMLFDRWGWSGEDVGLNFSNDFANAFEQFSGIDVSTAQGKVEVISAMMETLENSIENYADSDLYSGLQIAKEHYQDYVDAIDDSVNGLIDATVKQQMYSDILDKSSVKDAQSLETYRKTLIDLVANDGMIKQRLGDGIINQEDIEQQVDYYISTMSGLSDYYVDWMNQFDEATVARNEKVKEAFNLTGQAKELTEWYDSLPEGDKELVYSIVLNNTDEERQKTIEALDKMSEGGTVDLNLRPVVDTKVLKEAGWADAGEGAATVFTSTFANEAAERNEKGGVAMNFTPIIADENGNFVGVLSPEELEKYATDVINGTGEHAGDELNLKIGATFEGANAISQAEQVAESIHREQAKIYTVPEAENMSLDSYIDALDEVKEETVNAATIVSDSWKGTLEDFDALWGDDSQFKEGVDTYTEQLDTLKEAIEKFDSGELDVSDIIILRKEFKNLSKFSNKDLDKGLKKVYKDLLGVGDAADDDTGLIGLFNDQIEETEHQSPETADALRQIRDEYLNLYDLDGSVQIDPFQGVRNSLASTKALATALSEVSSNGYLSEQTIQDLIKANSGYKSVLQQTAAGMIIDTQKANELAVAQGELNLEIAEANKYASELSYKKNYDEMVKLAGGAKELQEILASGNREDYSKIFELNDLNTDLSADISQWESLAAEIRGTISLLQQYQNAQSSSNASDAYETVRGGLKGADELYRQGYYTKDDFTSYAKLLARNGATLEEAVMQYQQNRERFSRYLETDTAFEGVNNFWTDATKLVDEYGNALNYVTKDAETGQFTFDIDSMNEFADAMGVNTEMAEYFALALKDMGYIDLDLSMIGDSFAESIETLDLSSDTAVSDIDHLIDRMQYLESQGVDCSDSLPNIANALGQLQDAGVNIDPLISKLQELGYNLEFDEETKTFQFTADTSDVENAEAEIEGKELSETVDVEADTGEADAAIEEITKDETKTVTTEIVGGEESSTTPSSQDITVNVTQNPDPLVVNVDDATVTIKPDQDEYTIEVADATVTISPDKEEYSVSIADATVNVSTDKEEYSVNIADTTVTVTPDQESYTVSINGAEVAVVPDQESYDVVINGQTVTVTPDKEGYDVKINDQLVKVLPNQSSYDVEINDQKVTVTPDKEGYDVKINDQLVKVLPNQSSYDVEINDQKVTVTPDKDSYDVKINDQTVNVTPENDTITINAEAGDVESARSQMQATLNSNPLTVPVNPKGAGYLAEGADTPEIEAHAEVEENIDIDATAHVTSVDSSSLPNETAVDVKGEVNDVEVTEPELEPIEIEGDNSGLESEVQESESELDDLAAKETNPSITADNSQAESEISETENHLSTLNGETANPTISANDQASGVISSVSSELASLDGQTATTYIKTVHQTVNEGGGETSPANGTLGGGFAHGTVNAFVRGSNVSIGKNQTALVNELGNEMLVRDGRAYTIPGGAQYMHLKKGDIIFNHKQTEELKKYGKVTSGKGHGKIALSKGTVSAFYDSTLSSGGNIIIPQGANVTINNYSGDSGSGYSGDSGSSDSGGSGSGGSGSGGSSNSTKETEQSFDWIETKITRIESLIKGLTRIRDSVFNTWTKRNKTLSEELKEVGNEIEIQQKGYRRYLAEAEKAGKGLSQDYIKKLQNGEIDIDTIKDEDLKKKLKDYQTWYEKAMKCKDAVAELRETERELANQRLENIESKYDARLQNVRTRISNIESGMDADNASGRILGKTSAFVDSLLARASRGENVDVTEGVPLTQKSRKGYTNANSKQAKNRRKQERSNYNRLIKNSQKEEKTLVQKYTSMNAEFQSLVNNGTIEKGSEKWYEWKDAIASIKEEIEGCVQSQAEWNEAIANLKIDDLTDANTALQNKAAQRQHRLSVQEANGNLGNTKDYAALIENTNAQNKNIQKQNKLLTEQRDKYDVGSDKWKEYNDRIVENERTLEENELDIISWNEAIANLPIEKATRATQKLSDAMTILEKKLNNATKTSTKKTILEQELENVRATNKANQKAAKDTAKESKTANRKMNSVNDKFVKKLNISDKQKAALVKAVQNGEQIDYSAYSDKLTDKQRNTIIARNQKQLAADNAKQTAAESKEDTKAQIRDIAEQLANLAITSRDEKFEKISARNEVTSAQYDIAQTADDRNANLKEQNKQAKQIRNTYSSAAESAEAYVDETWKNVRKLAKKQGKSKGQELSTAGLDVNSQAYKNIIKYNEALKASETASLDAAKANAEYTATIQENAKRMFDNVVAEYDSSRDVSEAKMSRYRTHMDLRDAQGKSDVSKSEKNYLTKMIAEQQGIVANRQTAYANALQSYKANQKNMSSEDRQKALVELERLKEEADSAEISAIELQEQLDNIEIKKLGMSMDRLSAKSERLNDAIALKSVRGLSITSKDYKGLIKNSKNQVSNLEAQNEELKEQQKQYDKGSQKYQDLQKQIEQNEDTIRGAKQQQEEWNNSIAQIPFDKVAKQLEYLDSIASVHKAEQSLKTTRGLVLTAKDLKQSIADNNKEIKQYQKNFDNAMANAEKAAQSADGVFGGKTAKEWKEEANEASASIIGLTEDNESLKNSIAQIPFDKVAKQLEYLESISELRSSQQTLKTTKGLMLTAKDYQESIADNNKQIAQYQKEYNQALANAQKASENVDGVYGGKTAQEWRTEANGYIKTITDMTASNEELANSIVQIPFDKIDKEIEYLQAQSDYNESLRNLKSAKGQDLTELDYQNKISEAKKMQVQYERERHEAYENYLKALSSGEKVYGGKTAEEWLAEYNKFGTEINNISSDIEGIKDALRDDVYWRTFERAHQEAQRVKEVVEGINDLISDDMVYDRNGKLTEWGISRIANLVKEYEVARTEVGNYSNDIENLNTLYERGEYTEEEYKEKLSELKNSLLDSSASMKTYMDTIIDMYKEMAESELDNLNKLIDKRNDALQAKKDYYEFDKTLKNKNSELQSLKAQRDALEGISGAEAKAKRAKLDADIEEAQDELDEILMEHQFELSSNALSDLKDTLQEAFDDRWETIHQDFSAVQDILKNANNLVSSSVATITTQINELLHFYGINGASGISASVVTGYASGTKRVTKDEVARIGERGDEIYSKNGQLYTTFKSGDFVVPSDLSANLFKWAAVTPEAYYNRMIDNIRPQYSDKGNTINSNNSNHYDALVNIQGDVTKEVFPGVKEMCESAYRYMVREVTLDAKHAGIKVK